MAETIPHYRALPTHGHAMTLWAHRHGPRFRGLMPFNCNEYCVNRLLPPRRGASGCLKDLEREDTGALLPGLVQSRPASAFRI
jgi:hypothetical protein